ncbi:TPA: hypothetical protein I7730_16120 [Vibrio vulnificus]|uniref:Uncharacterized protein n=1 Tax=Vibrio vulnificus TaxID=672 RepID=A0A8H9N1X5_VIBVL|nr:hypothetical protein [Vibrio vulnificus]
MTTQSFTKSPLRELKGAAEDYGFDGQTDELEAVDANEIAKEVADATNSELIWDCIKPGWA